MSLRKAIDEKCKDCIFDSKSGFGNWRQQVQGCPAVDCPLWPVRPISKPKKVKDHEKFGKKLMENTW